MDEFNFDTLAVRAGSLRTEFNEHSEALFLTSSFCFASAAEAAKSFANSTEEHYTYSRFANPSVDMFQRRLAALEGGEMCVATASGMSAIMAAVMGVLQTGDHLVSSRSIFGSTINMFSTLFSRFGIHTTFVDLTDHQAWQSAVRPETKMFFLETPSNPLTEIADLKKIGDIAKAANALLVVDNCLCTPALQQPLKLGADLVVHSATKYLDGQGRVLGGAIVGSKALMQEKILPFVRNTGPTLSAFNAWILLKGMETLTVRLERQSKNALTLAQWLLTQPVVDQVFYPGLPSHPQYELAQRQQRAGGALLSFEVKGATPEAKRANAWRLMDQTRLCSITGNLGDTRTTITHPATTTHSRISPQARAAAGITEGLIRLAVGLEHSDDLRQDLARGLGK
ncbi:O-succinylhomoserine sulfhydrylase [Mycoavidus sp. B2-EB]|uniref:O-succinylhomoserine sulfhydrylase n=1 Tax=Mycoavidus sp. B2-EB TaxID=2651972 RepID=UPI00308F3526|nr:O-succinylhomoserine sulfhydrylase [Mycoavidus sp. B2-EB]